MGAKTISRDKHYTSLKFNNKRVTVFRTEAETVGVDIWMASSNPAPRAVTSLIKGKVASTRFHISLQAAKMLHAALADYLERGCHEISA